MKILIFLSRLIAGLVFIFSGVVKAIDPLGSTYKFQDYFMAFNMDFLLPLSLPLAILLCSAEFLSGVSVLFNFRQKTGIWGLMLLMMIFTPLTFVLALTNPVTDCGCFGDVIHLTNWQTFIKNIILLVPVVLSFYKQEAGYSQTWNRQGMDNSISNSYNFRGLQPLQSQVSSCN